VDAGTGAAAPAAEEGDPPALRHEISLSPSRSAADSPTKGTVQSGPTVSIASAQAAAAEQRSEGASSTAASASAGPAATGVLSLSPVKEPSAGVGPAPEDGATFSAFAAAQAQRGGASAVSLSDTMFASTASTARSAADTAARASAQQEPGTAGHASGAAGMSQSAGSSEGAGTGREQAPAPAEGRGMPPRESMLSATDLVEHGQRAAAADAQEVEAARNQSEEAQSSPPAAAVLGTDELAAAASMVEGRQQAAAEESSGSQPADEPPPPDAVRDRWIGPEGAVTDVQPPVITSEAGAQQPGASAAPTVGPAAAAENRSGADADAAPLAAELQMSSLQGSDATQTAAIQSAVVPATAVPSESDVSGAEASPAAVETQHSDAEPGRLAIAGPVEAGPASAHAAEPLQTAERRPEHASGSLARADPAVVESPAGSQAVQSVEPAPMGCGEAALHDRGPAQEAGNETASRVSEPPREAASGGEQITTAGATAVSDEGDDMLDAQSQHSEGSTVSI